VTLIFPKRKYVKISVLSTIKEMDMTLKLHGHAVTKP
jgi:hypothetical protein